MNRIFFYTLKCLILVWYSQVTLPVLLAASKSIERPVYSFQFLTFKSGDTKSLLRRIAFVLLLKKDMKLKCNHIVKGYYERGVTARLFRLLELFCRRGLHACAF